MFYAKESDARKMAELANDCAGYDKWCVCHIHGRWTLIRVVSKTSENMGHELGTILNHNLDHYPINPRHNYGYGYDD